MDTLHTKTLPFLVPFIGSFLATHTLSPIAPPPPPMGQSRLTTPKRCYPPPTLDFPLSLQSQIPQSHCREKKVEGRRTVWNPTLCWTSIPLARPKTLAPYCWRVLKLRIWRSHTLQHHRRVHILWSRRILKLHMRPDFSNCGYCNRSTHCTNVTLDQSLTCKNLVFLCWIQFL